MVGQSYLPCVGNLCTYPSSQLPDTTPRLPPPCHSPCCPPLVGPTGPTGPTGPAPLPIGPSFVLSASLNHPTLALEINTLTVIPFNQVISSNLAGAAQFSTSTGAFTVLVPGTYRIDYGVMFLASTTVLAGNNLVLAVRQNLLPLANTTFTFYTQSLLFPSTNSLNNSWTYDFNIGDRISITALWTSGVANTCSISGSAATGFPPYNTVFSVRSLF